MKAYTIFKIAYILSFILITAGVLFKIQHWPNGSNVMLIGLLSAIAYIFLGIQAVFSNPDIDVPEKMLWAIGFICFGAIAGLVYIILKPTEKEYKNKIS